MGITENELMGCSLIWLAGALVILLAVWLVISHKDRSLRRRQRRYREAYDATIGQGRYRRKG